MSHKKGQRGQSKVDNSKRVFLKKGGAVLLATSAYQVISLFVKASDSYAWTCCVRVTSVRTPSGCGVRGLREDMPSPVDQWSSPPEDLPSKLRGASGGAQAEQSAFPEINDKAVHSPKGKNGNP